MIQFHSTCERCLLGRIASEKRFTAIEKMFFQLEQWRRTWISEIYRNPFQLIRWDLFQRNLLQANGIFFSGKVFYSMEPFCIGRIETVSSEEEQMKKSSSFVSPSNRTDLHNSMWSDRMIHCHGKGGGPFLQESAPSRKPVSDVHNCELEWDLLISIKMRSWWVLTIDFRTLTFFCIIWAVSVSTSRLVSFAWQAPFESRYTSIESPFLFSIDRCMEVWVDVRLSLFSVGGKVHCWHFRLNPSAKLDLLRYVSSVGPPQIKAHSIALWKLYTRAPIGVRKFVGKTLLSGLDCTKDS
jgi:hypothetical protein